MEGFRNESATKERVGQGVLESALLIYQNTIVLRSRDILSQMVSAVGSGVLYGSKSYLF